jgi:cardiolipin synthase
VPVTQLAKWKTVLQNIAIGFLIAGEAGDIFVNRLLAGGPASPVSDVGVGLLWLSALLTLYTGYDYFRAGIRHLIEE